MCYFQNYRTLFFGNKLTLNQIQFPYHARIFDGIELLGDHSLVQRKNYQTHANAHKSLLPYVDGQSHSRHHLRGKDM